MRSIQTTSSEFRQGRTVLLLVAAIGAGATACGPEVERSESETARRDEALTFSYTQPTNLPTITGSPFSGGVAGSGYYDYGGTSDSDMFACRSCSYTNYDDVSSSLRAHELSRNLNASSVYGELNSYASNLWSYGTNSGLAGRVLAAEPDVGDAFDASYMGTSAGDILAAVSDVADLIDSFPGVGSADIHVTAPSMKYWAIAFEPIHVRALTANNYGSTVYNWQPVAHREARFRGARSYCAMRQAAREQRAQNDAFDTMGAQSLGSWWLWDYGNTESTVKVGAPLQVGKEPGQTEVTSTGANAFSIPVALGAKITPLHGPLFPDFPEVAHPFVWVTGDSEVESHEGSRDYLNAQHADFWNGQYFEDAGIDIDEVPLFTWGGIVTMTASGGLSMTMGKPVDGQCGSAPNSMLGDGRALVFGAMTCSQRPGYLARSYEWDPLSGYHHRPSAFASDAPYTVSTGSFPLLPTEDDGTYAQWAAFMPDRWGIYQRLQTNDDRSVVLMDSAEEHLALSVSVGLSFGPVEVSISGTSSLSNETRQLTTIREHVSVVEGSNILPDAYEYENSYGNAILPQSNFVVSSESSNIAAFDPLKITANFEMEISVPFIGSVDIDWHQTFFEIAGDSNPTGPLGVAEGARLRVGEYSDWGNDFSEEGTTGREVMSHLPTASGSPHFFASWPNGTGEPLDVPTCLADTSAPDDPPEPEEGTPGEQKSGELCWYGPASVCSKAGCDGVAEECYWNPWALPADACNPTVKSQWLANFSGALQDCFDDMLTYLCSGTHLQQTWGNEGSVVAHVYSTSESSTVQAIFDTCVEGVVAEVAPSTQSEAECLGNKLGQLFKMHACKQDATLDGDAP